MKHAVLPDSAFLTRRISFFPMSTRLILFVWWVARASQKEKIGRLVERTTCHHCCYVTLNSIGNVMADFLAFVTVRWTFVVNGLVQCKRMLDSGKAALRVGMVTHEGFAATKSFVLTGFTASKNHS